MRFVWLSSTTSARHPTSDLPAALRAATGAEAWARGRRSQNVLPAPGRLSTPTVPPIASASRRQMASPRPVPPYRRVVEASAWAKGSKSRSAVAGSIPTPVSVTSKRTVTPAAVGWPATPARSTTSPDEVNFTALVAKFNRIWRSRPTSPRRAVGRSALQ